MFWLGDRSPEEFGVEGVCICGYDTDTEISVVKFVKKKWGTLPSLSLPSPATKLPPENDGVWVRERCKLAPPVGAKLRLQTHVGIS